MKEIVLSEYPLFVFIITKFFEEKKNKNHQIGSNRKLCIYFYKRLQKHLTGNKTVIVKYF